MTLLLTADDVRRAADLPGVLLALDTAHRAEYTGAAAITERVNLCFASGWLRLMAAALPEFGVVGYKEFHFVGNEVRFQINLFDIDSGVPLACLDANYLTVLRTATTAALAAVRLVPQASAVGIIGSGHEARMQAAVVGQLLAVDRMSIYSPRAERRQLLARDLAGELGIPVRAVDSGAAAVHEADLIMVATNTAGAGPAFFADWISATTAHISSTGSTMPAERELDAAVWAYPDLIVVDRMQALEESGDAMAAADAGTLDSGKVITLAELCGRQVDEPPQRTMYKSVGSPLQDIAVAAYAYRKAAELGLGRRIEDVVSVKSSVPVPVGRPA
ncbi:ornithine cyclodeaminase family protein [Nocardia altamirensis]|uniref:ornithine cyclodeaminase family protein n=1 Tax=Nocardia altamirensis TaxID=472158 RepID=UPI0008401E91|nr:ornithine cyclodeaminase family protein [Nocardia altamirensis]